MKKSDLEKLIGKNWSGSEIKFVSYDKETKAINIKLINFEFHKMPSGEYIRVYGDRTTDIQIFDKFAFHYKYNNIEVSSIGNIFQNEQINSDKLLTILFTLEKSIPKYSTAIQKYWREFLIEINAFNEKEYIEKFIDEFKRYIVKNFKENSSDSSKEYISYLFNNLAKDFDEEINIK